MILRYEAVEKQTTRTRRASLIETLNNVQFLLGKGDITPLQFESFSCMSIHQLETLVLDQTAELNRKAYDNRIQGADF